MKRELLRRKRQSDNPSRARAAKDLPPSPLMNARSKRGVKSVDLENIPELKRIVAR